MLVHFTVWYQLGLSINFGLNFDGALCTRYSMLLSTLLSVGMCDLVGAVSLSHCPAVCDQTVCIGGVHNCVCVCSYNNLNILSLFCFGIFCCKVCMFVRMYVCMHVNGMNE